MLISNRTASGGGVSNPANDMPTPSPESTASANDASLTHTRFVCHHPECDDTFSRRQDRDRHMRKHDGVREYACSVPNCTRRFYRKDKLRSHLDIGHKRKGIGSALL